MSDVHERSIVDIAKDIDSTIEQLKDLPEDKLSLVKRLKELIEEFNRIPLIKIVRHLKQSEEGKAMLIEMVKDPDIYALFLKHNIVKPDVKTEVAKVIELIKPYVRSHGGDVELVDVKGDTVYVRMKGACQGCSQVSTTLHEGILEAVRTRVPQINRIELVKDTPSEAFVLFDENRSKNIKWKKTFKLVDCKEKELLSYKDSDISVILINWNGTVYTYKDCCAHQGLPLSQGTVDGNGILTCPWHGFQYDITTGECLTSNLVQLEPVPIKIEEGWIYVGVADGPMG